MPSVALVAFRGTIADKVMQSCRGFAKFKVGSSRKAINSLVESGVLNNFERVIAMGLKNKSRDLFVHVEEICFINDHKVLLDTSLADNILLKPSRMSKALQSSWCNLLVAALKNRYPDKQVAFLHIPPKANVASVATAIDSGLA